MSSDYDWNNDCEIVFHEEVCSEDEDFDEQEIIENDKEQISENDETIINEQLADDIEYYTLNDYEYEANETRAPAARAVSRNISCVLRDKQSTTRGNQMFQKRRRRSEKFAIVSYGTQPAEEEEFMRTCDTPDSMLPLSDVEIEAYDKPGVHDPQLDDKKNNLKPVKLQTKGRGAKLFFKRQQRMKKFVIEDDNQTDQNHQNNPSMFVLSPQSTTAKSANSNTNNNCSNNYIHNTNTFYNQNAKTSTNSQYYPTSNYSLSSCSAFDTDRMIAAVEARNSCQAATMKGRGAKLFQRQQKRMKKYTSEVQECSCPVDPANHQDFQSNITFKMGAKLNEASKKSSIENVRFMTCPPSADDFISDQFNSNDIRSLKRVGVKTKSKEKQNDKNEIEEASTKNKKDQTFKQNDQQKEFILREQSLQKEQQDKKVHQSQFTRKLNTKIATTEQVKDDEKLQKSCLTEKSEVALKINLPKKGECRSVHQIKLTPKSTSNRQNNNKNLQQNSKFVIKFNQQDLNNDISKNTMTSTLQPTPYQMKK